jgi:signal transduction histidine kinase
MDCDMTLVSPLATESNPDLPESHVSSMRREQLRIIERTSVPGVVSALAGGVVLAVLAFQPGFESIGRALPGLVPCLALMGGLWAYALYACRRNDLVGAIASQFAANMIGTVLFFVFVERGAILAIFTTLVALCSTAMVFDDRRQRVATAFAIVTTLGAAALGEARLVEAIVLPPFVLYAAVAVTVVFGYRNPISAFRVFGQRVASSRAEALKNEHLAREAKDRADAHARDLESLSAELRDFLYVVSHDLRAPLINIDGFANVLRDALEDFEREAERVGMNDPIAAAWQRAKEETTEALHFISSGTRKLDDLIKGLLELSRIDQSPLREETVVLQDVVSDAVNAVGHQIRERDIDVEVGPMPDIAGERLRMSQVFGNLIENAVKYMPDREPRAIFVESEEDGDSFVFTVRDTGNGIPPDSRQKVFRPFKRLQPGGSVSGEGIGLAAVKKIIERHGGRIWIEDGRDGVGVSVRFTWPRRNGAATAVPSERAAA